MPPAVLNMTEGLPVTEITLHRGETGMAAVDLAVVGFLVVGRLGCCRHELE